MIPARTTITISQEEGSGGQEIAQEVAKILRLNYIDREVINLATEHLSNQEIEWFIRGVAEQGRVVIVDCGANFILRERPGVINILLRAPLQYRIDRVSYQHHLGREAATRRIERCDEQQRGYVRRYYGPEWTSSDLYDLVVNTAARSTAELAAAIAQFVRELERANSFTETRDWLVRRSSQGLVGSGAK